MKKTEVLGFVMGLIVTECDHIFLVHISNMIAFEKYIPEMNVLPTNADE